MDAEDNMQIIAMDDKSKEDILLDLNFYYRRIDKITSYIDDMKNKIDIKYTELENILDSVRDHLEKANDNEKKILIEDSIETLDDLIAVAKRYGSPSKLRRYTVNTEILYNIIEPLEELNNVVGLDDIKEQIVDQIITSLLGMYDDDIMFHTVIKGPPGVGKTMIAKILGKIYLRMGVLKNDNDKLKFIIARRSDLIGKYLGHTAIKTQECIDKCDGGVLFIDEVYALGNPEKKDSFSKECIDTLNLNLTEKKNFICIIAGYEEEINECFFNYNPGLKRRFPFTYVIKDYKPEDLRKIFLIKLKNSEWSLHEDISNRWIDKQITDNDKYFKNYGGDIDNLILNIKIVHGRRIFGKDEKLKKVITKEDINKGIKKLIKSKDINKDDTPFMMYI